MSQPSALGERLMEAVPFGTMPLQPRLAVLLLLCSALPGTFPTPERSLLRAPCAAAVAAPRACRESGLKDVNRGSQRDTR